MPKIIKILTAIALACLFAFKAQAEYISPDQNPDNNNTGMVGPMQVTATYSNVFGPIFGGHWTNYVTPDNAFGFELDFGGDEFRLGGTLTHSITPSQRVKLSAEHYAQQFNFEFLSGEKVRWVGQNDFGATYQYLFLQNPWLKNFSLGAYYTTAESETLNNGNPVIFITPQRSVTSLQRFEGANNTVGWAGVSVEPWTQARIAADVNYDDTKYHPLYVSPKNSSGPGGTLALEQVLTGHLKFDLLGSHFAPYNQFQAGASWLFNTRPGTRLEMDLSGSRVQGHILNSNDNRVMLAFAYSWDGDPCGPRANYLDENPDDFITWTTKPAVYMPAVLVQKDEKILRIAH